VTVVVTVGERLASGCDGEALPEADAAALAVVTLLALAGCVGVPTVLHDGDVDGPTENLDVSVPNPVDVRDALDDLLSPLALGAPLPLGEIDADPEGAGERDVEREKEPDGEADAAPDVLTVTDAEGETRATVAVAPLGVAAAE